MRLVPVLAAPAMNNATQPDRGLHTARPATGNQPAGVCKGTEGAGLGRPRLRVLGLRHGRKSLGLQVKPAALGQTRSLLRSRTVADSTVGSFPAAAQGLAGLASQRVWVDKVGSPPGRRHDQGHSTQHSMAGTVGLKTTSA